MTEIDQNKTVPPEVFISYCWTDPEYVDWVRELAEELQENNIKVHLDQWLLREGDNKFVYMERMVTDSQIQEFTEEKRRSPSWNGFSPNIEFYLGVSKIGTRP